MSLDKQTNLRRPFATALAIFLVTIFLGANVSCARLGEKKDEQSTHGHDDPADASPDAIHLSEEARKTIGLVMGPVKTQTYTDTITVPGIVVEQPGRTVRHVPAPLGGIVERVYRTDGETVEPGEPLFVIHLMHEELVGAQGEYLRLFETRKVIESEIKRLEEIARQGVIAGKKLLERQNEHRKISAQLNAQRQRLLLHGLSEKDVKHIEQQHELIHGITVTAPMISRGAEKQKTTDETPTATETLQVRHLHVAPGQHVEAGTSLCELVDYSQLFIEGHAFASDVPYLQDVIKMDRQVSADIGSSLSWRDTEDNLKVVYVDNSVNPDTRLHSFYLRLPNQTVTGNENALDRYVGWKYRPGQRAKIRIPTSKLPERIVLPLEALVQDGLESYVFLESGDELKRRAVHVERRDTEKNQIVLAPGSLYEGTIIAMNSADLLNLELKNKSGGGVDPHHGHAH